VAVVTAGLYEVSLFQEYFGEVCLNTFYYLSNAGANDGQEELATLFDTLVLPYLPLVQNPSVFYTNIRVTPIFGTGVEENRIPTTANGSLTGQALPSFVALSLRLLRSTNELRSGWKRFVGLTEEVVGASSLAGSLIADATTLANALDANLVGTSDFYKLAITRKPFSTKAMSPNWEAIDVNGVVVVNRPTTQNSRKQF